MEFLFEPIMSSLDAVSKVGANLFSLGMPLVELAIDKVFSEIFLAFNVKNEAGFLESDLLEVRKIFHGAARRCEGVDVGSAVA